MQLKIDGGNLKKVVHKKALSPTEDLLTATRENLNLFNW